MIVMVSPAIVPKQEGSFHCIDEVERGEEDTNLGEEIRELD